MISKIVPTIFFYLGLASMFYGMYRINPSAGFFFGGAMLFATSIMMVNEIKKKSD